MSVYVLSAISNRSKNQPNSGHLFTESNQAYLPQRITTDLNPFCFQTVKPSSPTIVNSSSTEEGTKLSEKSTGNLLNFRFSTSFFRSNLKLMFCNLFRLLAIIVFVDVNLVASGCRVPQLIFGS